MANKLFSSRLSILITVPDCKKRTKTYNKELQFVEFHNHSPLLTKSKTGEYPSMFPTFQHCECCEKYLKDNKHYSLHWTPPWTLSASWDIICSSKITVFCELLGTDDVRVQISQHILKTNGDYCLYIAQLR